MLETLFGIQVYRSPILLEPEEISIATRLAIEADLELNPHRVAYSRPDKTSLDTLYPEAYGPIFAKLKAVTEAAYRVRVTRMTGRESVFLDGQHIPVHVEGEADLSAVLWLDWSARPNPIERDYCGMLSLQNPSGVFGFKKLPWEAPRSQLFEPIPGSAIIHPSYVPHFVFPYRGERPGVEIHFEFFVEAEK